MERQVLEYQLDKWHGLTVHRTYNASGTVHKTYRPGRGKFKQLVGCTGRGGESSNNLWAGRLVKKKTAWELTRVTVTNAG